VRSLGFEARQQRQQFRDESRQLFLQADDLERYITEQVLESVQIITCTLVGAANRSIRHLTFETVFIDEAAQALEPGCWIPIAKGERVILFTDHKQASTSDLLEFCQKQGAPEIAVPKKIVVVAEIPVLGTGKTDYVAIQRLAEREAAKAEAA
jgi:acyl-CoA synthetase (AMP-forming)/AMP-acid ligase II